MIMQKTLAPLTQSSETDSSAEPWLRDLLETLLLALVLYLILNAVTGRYQVLSVSMQPTLHEGEYLLTNKASYWLRPVQRGDIVVFHPPNQPEDSIPLIKRVIGLPGERVEARDGRIWINGTALNEPYVSGPLTYDKTWFVEETTYVVLGDNRNNSSDSHHWGLLPRKNMIGKTVFRYWPLDKFGRLVHHDYPKLEEIP